MSTIKITLDEVHVGDGYYTSFYLESMTKEQKREVNAKGFTYVSQEQIDNH